MRRQVGKPVVCVTIARISETVWKFVFGRSDTQKLAKLNRIPIRATAYPGIIAFQTPLSISYEHHCKLRYLVGLHTIKTALTIRKCKNVF